MPLHTATTHSEVCLRGVMTREPQITQRCTDSLRAVLCFGNCIIICSNTLLRQKISLHCYAFYLFHFCHTQLGVSRLNAQLDKLVEEVWNFKVTVWTVAEMSQAEKIQFLTLSFSWLCNEGSVWETRLFSLCTVFMRTFYESSHWCRRDWGRL